MSPQPNILLILIDDLGARDLGAFGSTFYETPRLDHLVREGMKFNQAYASCPVCSPTRASIMSGKYPARVGITQFIGGSAEGKLKDVPYLHYLPLTETSLASALREGGYQTWHVGKWHLGDDDFFPDKHGFDVNLGGCHWGMPNNGYFSPWNIPTLEDGSEGQYLTDHLTDDAIELIKNRADKPFFMQLAHYAVHTPIQAPPELVEKYRAKAKRLKLDQQSPFIDGDYFPCIHKSDRKIQRRIVQSDPEYAAMMENLDTNIGRVLDALEEEGLTGDTIVIFTSDNGGLATAEGSPTCNLPFAEGKGWNEEGGTRVCQMIRWPGVITPGSQCDIPVTSTDFYPTLLAAAGLPPRPEQHRDGVNLMPLLKQSGNIEREAVYWHYPHYGNQGGTPAASLVTGDGRWKLIKFFEDDNLELYDLENDISEVRNLAPEMPGKTEKLHQMLLAWQDDVEAKIPEPNPDYEAKIKRPKIPNNAYE